MSRAEEGRTAVCLCGRTKRHLPTVDCAVVVFQNEDRSTTSETRGEVEQRVAPCEWPAHRDEPRCERAALLAENERLRAALNDIVHASRDDGLAAMCNWMRGRALAALTDRG